MELEVDGLGTGGDCGFSESLRDDALLEYSCVLFTIGRIRKEEEGKWWNANEKWSSL